MQVLHVNNPANVAWGLANALREAGCASHVLDLWPGGNGYPTDHRADARGPVRRVLSVPRAARVIARYDVVHLHDCDPLAGRLVRSVKRARVVLHHHGSLLRAGRAPAAPPGAHEIVATPDLLLHRPHATYLPAPMPTLAAVPHPARSVPLVGHYPSDPTKKGTAEILEAIRPFVDAGKLRLDMGTGLPHDEVLRRLANCDAVVDQWTPEIGAYGVVALEAFAIGRPVIVSASPDRYPGLPTLGASLREAFEAVAADPARLPSLGLASREYALSHHDRGRIVRTLLALYDAKPAVPALVAPAEAPALA